MLRQGRIVHTVEQIMQKFEYVDRRPSSCKRENRIFNCTTKSRLISTKDYGAPTLSQVQTDAKKPSLSLQVRGIVLIHGKTSKSTVPQDKMSYIGPKSR